MIRALIIALTWLLLALLLFYPMAYAQEHRHPDQTIHGATALFYETWMRPDMPSSSCCNKSDCDVAIDVKRIGDQLWARKRSGGPLVSIPPEKIEVNRDSPDGENHICAIGTTVLCFVFGLGS